MIVIGSVSGIAVGTDRRGPDAAVARDLGYVGGTTHQGETATELAPWIGVCPAGHLAYRHRRVTRPTSCAKCAPRFDERFVFTWSRREISPAARLAAMTPR